jgi:putative ABC transport system substrate-binding protein
MKRREFITLFGGAAAAWPLSARAQQQPAMPVVGFLHPASPEAFAENLRGFRQGLKETGYVEGENVAFEFRWADGQLGRLPELAADLVRRRVAVIATASPPAAFAAKAATTTIPIVFVAAEDPVRSGFAQSTARPSGNITGTWVLGSDALVGKRLDFLKLSELQLVFEHPHDLLICVTVRLNRGASSDAPPDKHPLITGENPAADLFLR